MVIFEILFSIILGIGGGTFFYCLMLGPRPEDMNFGERVAQYCVAIGMLILTFFVVGSKETNFYDTIMFFTSLIPGFIILWISFKADNERWIDVKRYRK